MIRIVLAIIGLAFGASARAGCDLPPLYKEEIRAVLAAKHPEYTTIHILATSVGRVAVGEARRPMCAVRCWWTGLGGENTMLGSVMADFLFDRPGLLAKAPRQATPEDKLEWIDPAPKLPPQKRQPVARANRFDRLTAGELYLQ